MQVVKVIVYRKLLSNAIQFKFPKLNYVGKPACNAAKIWMWIKICFQTFKSTYYIFLITIFIRRKNADNGTTVISKRYIQVTVAYKKGKYFLPDHFILRGCRCNNNFAVTHCGCYIV